MKKQTIKETPEIGLDIRSNAVSEILGQAPNWVIRWGISIVLMVVVLLLIGAALIRYNDVVPARITITTQEPPVYIKARTSGKISEIFVTTDQPVGHNQILAVIENTARAKDVLRLKQTIYDFQPGLAEPDSTKARFPLTLALGDLQAPYQDFIKHYQNYLLHLKNKPNEVQAALLLDQMKEQQKLLERQQAQLALFEKELKLSSKAYERNMLLLDSNVISVASFEELSRTYLSDKQQYESLQMQMVNTRINISSLNGSRTGYLLDDEEKRYNNRKLLEEAVQNLKNAIENWEQLYVLQSPVAGKVTLFDVWNKYQNVEMGEVLFTVVPEKKGDLIGHLVLPVQNSGKVSPGQKVIIKTDNYPHPEWGSLTGFVTSISSVPKQGLAEYAISVRIKSLTTSYGKTMEFRQEMQGTAEIVTEELTVLQRIFYQLRGILDRS